MSILKLAAKNVLFKKEENPPVDPIEYTQGAVNSAKQDKNKGLSPASRRTALTYKNQNIRAQNRRTPRA